MIQFDLYHSTTKGDTKNTSYSYKKTIKSVADLIKVAGVDHVGCRFNSARNNRKTLIQAYRSNKTFLEANVIIMDVDNTNQDPTEPDLTETDWCTPAQVAATFPGVPFYVVYSRNHMKEKNGHAPRPKFHVYFPLSRSYVFFEDVEKLKRKVQRIFPAFDPNAIKVTQFMFGVDEPKVECFEGSEPIDKFIKNDEKLPDVIHESERNVTMSRFAGKIITRMGDTKEAREAFDKVAERCQPPLPKEELDTIWRSAQSFYHETVKKTPGYIEPDEYEENGGHSKHKGFTVDDMRSILKTLNIRVRFNEITRRMEVTGLPEKNSVANADNTLTSQLLGYMSKNGFHCSNRAFDTHLASIIDENRYNPVEEMLKETVWDGKDRIKELLDEILCLQGDGKGEGKGKEERQEDRQGAGKRDRSSLDRILVTKWLHQCVAMALNDEKKPLSAAGVLVLQGEQGIGKTMIFSKLAVHREWFADGKSIDMRNKDNIIQATERWITELGELDATLRNEQSALKGFLTSNMDTYRMPYAKNATSRARKTSFCGTVNPEEFLNDETGSRRFWVVSAKNMNLKKVLDMDEAWAAQLWTQVYQELYKPNPAGFCLTSEESNSLQTRNEAYTKMLPGEIEILDKFDFQAPKGDWKWKKVSEVTEAMYAKGIGSIQIGRVLAKFKKTKKLEVKNNQGSKSYLLPPMIEKPPFSD